MEKIKIINLISISIISYVIILVITYVLLREGIVSHELRSDLSLHIFVGLMAYNFIFFGIKSLFDKDSPKFKQSVLISLFLSIIILILINSIFIKNWIITSIIEVITMIIFGNIFVFINRKKIFINTNQKP